MYTLSLDEYGNFEKKDGKETPVLIAGAIYDDCGEQYEDNVERKRIKAYYEAVIGDVKSKKGFSAVKYPRSLHVSTGTDEDLKLVGAVKRKISDTLGEFLKSGTYKGKMLSLNKGGKNETLEKRKGKYFVYTIIKSSDGKSRALRANAGTLLADGTASNLYLNMISEVLDRCMFNTTYAKDKSEFALDLATRTTATLNRSDGSVAEYTDLGYNGVKKDYKKNDIKTADDKLGVYFTLTNDDVFRSMIGQKMTDDNPGEMRLNRINVKSITYSQEEKKQEFLFLADSICSVLSFELDKKLKTSDEWLLELDGRMDTLIPKERQLLYGYDDVDTVFSDILKKYHLKDYYGALDTMNGAAKMDSEFSRFYKERWFHFIEAGIISDSDPNTLRRAVNTLYDSQKTNRYDQDKGLYIGRILERQAENVKVNLPMRESRYVFFRLYECLMVAYCHLGDCINAEKYYGKLSSYAYSATVEDYLRARNLIVVCMMDSFRWEGALNLAKKNLVDSGEYRSVKKNISGEFNVGTDIEVAKAESTMGQVYALLGKEDAGTHFNAALGYFEVRNADYYITQSYLLHYYLDVGLYEKYDAEAKSYFGNKKTDMDRLRYIFDEGLRDDPIFNYKFALYVFIKGLYLRGSKKISQECWTFLADIEENINESYKDRLYHPFYLFNHPCELICKYLMLIALERGDDKTAENYREKSAVSIKADDTEILRAIVLKGELDYVSIKGEKKEKEVLINAIYDMMVEMGSDVASQKDASLKDREETVNKYFRYMYN